MKKTSKLTLGSNGSYTLKVLLNFARLFGNLFILFFYKQDWLKIENIRSTRISMYYFSCAEL